MNAEGRLVVVVVVVVVEGEKEIEGSCFPATIPAPAPVPDPRLLPICSGPTGVTDTLLTDWAVPVAVVFVHEGDAGREAGE